MKINIIFAAWKFGVWCSWLAFLHGVQAVARSSRATPTKNIVDLLSAMFFYLENIFTY